MNLRLRTWLRYQCALLGKRSHKCVDTLWCDAYGVRTQQVLRQDGTVCQTAGAIVCDSRPVQLCQCFRVC